MGRFHRHDEGTVHDDHHSHEHEHELGDHSGYTTGAHRVSVLERIFDENDAAADANRAALGLAGVVCLNVMSSPGAGKTTLLERTLRHIQGSVRAGVIQGDIETSLDADRLAGMGAQISLLNTASGFGGECHLDAPMVASALRRIDLDGLDLLFVENVGNLVCPAEFDVGAHHRVMVCSITEGEDKPLKYPVMFRAVELVLINKIDLLAHLDFDLQLLEANLRQVNPRATVLKVSTRTSDGLDSWYSWLHARLADAPVRAQPLIPRELELEESRLEI
jgi:hydrogenase nickel incorporation protein HypB